MAELVKKYQQYDEYKKVTLGWLDSLPSHWQVKKLKYLGDSIIGLTYSPDDVVQFEDKGTLVLRSSNVQNKKLAFDNNVYVKKEIPEKLRTQLGDILICARNGSRALIGKNAEIDESAVGLTFGAFMMIFRSEHNRYLSYVFNSAIFEYQSGTFLTATINQLTSSNLNSFEVPLPPKAEQAKIANFLHHETAQIDTLIDKQQTLIQLLKEKRQAVISHAVTKGLNPDAPMKDSGVEWLGEVPEHWEVSKLKFESEIIDCRNKTPEYFENGEYFVVRTTNVRHQKLNFNGALYTDKKNFEIWTQRGVPPAGSIFFTREAPTGEVCLVPENLKFCMGQRMMNFIAHEENYTNYLFDYLISDCLERYINSVSHGSTVTHLRVEQVQNIPVLVPPLEEVAQIHNHIEKLKLNFDAIELNANKAIQLMQERRTALISAAVTGKIDVRGWVAPD